MIFYIASQYISMKNTNENILSCKMILWNYALYLIVNISWNISVSCVHKLKRLDVNV